MSNITLSAGIRQNLLSLQQTSAELTSTQEALSTGNKVNSAADNPSAYFTAQNLNNSANALSALLDQVGQGQQTINEATNGLTGITSLLQQALSTAQQAQQAGTGTLTYANIQGSQSIAADTTQATSAGFTTTGLTAATLGNATAADANVTAGAGNNGDKLIFTIGSNVVTATFSTTTDAGAKFETSGELQAYLASQFASTVATVTDNGGNLSVTSNIVGTGVTVTGSGALGANFNTTAAAAGSQIVLTDQSSSNSTLYYVTGDTNANATANGTFSTLAQLQLAANAATNTNGEITAGISNGNLTLASGAGDGITVAGDVGAALGFNTAQYLNNYNASLSAAVNANDTLTVQVGSNTAHTLTFGTGNGQISTLAGLNTALGGFGDITAAVTGGKLTLTPTSTSAVTVGGSALSTFGIATSTTPVPTVVTPDATRATLQTNYNTLLTQIDQLASDASYNGVNLLGGDNLVVDFNASGSSSLTIQGVNDSSTGLGLSQLNNSEFQDDTKIQGIVANINSAISGVQAQTETFGVNSGTITTRQTFTNATINTLQTGATNLVAADQNQESALLLTEQTNQQLEISALSIANQANQSVLKLFG